MVSTLAGGNTKDEDDVPDSEKTVFDWCKEGRVKKLESLVTEDCINTKDSQVTLFCRVYSLSCCRLSYCLINTGTFIDTLGL